MKTIKIENKEYILEYTFEAARYKSIVQSMFKVKSGTYLLGVGDNSVVSMLNGTADMISDIPNIAIDAFYAGLLEHNPGITLDESKDLVKKYLKENKISFSKLFEDINKWMAEDGFFDLCGLTEMMEEMEKSMNENPTEAPKKKVELKDHKKKSTSTK